MGRGPTPVLKGVKCIVDVRMSAGDADVDCSAAVSEKLESLGAKVVKRLGRDTTHVVWLNGNRNVREDTLKRSEVKLVGPLWVEACLQTATRVPETKFFPVETIANKSTPLPSPAAEKKKRRRSSLMEPRREDVFDELTTPIKKSRRQTLEPVTPLAITLTPQEGVNARNLSLRRRSRSPDYDDVSQPTAPTNLSTVDESFELPSQPDVARQSIESTSAATPSKATRASKRQAKSPATPASSIKTTPKSAVKDSKQTTWPCSSCTFENQRLAKRCNMCGTPATGGAPSLATESSAADDRDATKPSTRQSAKQLRAPTTPSPLPLKKQRQTTPIIGTPKQNQVPPRRSTATKSPSIPLVKVATPAKSSKATTATAPQPTKTKANKAAKEEAPDVAPKQPAKRKAVIPNDPGRAVKAKTSHATAAGVDATTKKTPTKKAATLLKATTAKPAKRGATPAAAPAPAATKTKRTARHVISVSGANLDTRLLLESSMREIDASSSGDGKSRVVDDFAAVVTHVVVSDNSKRTMKILFGLAQGAHIVSDAWVFSSLEAKKWLNETPFLVTQYPVPKKRPPHLLEGNKVYVASGIDPPKAALQALIVAAGGQVCTQMAAATLCIGVDAAVGRRAKQAGIPMVSPKWLFDSLASGALCTFPDAPVES